jgi:hypothetical protein
VADTKISALTTLPAVLSTVEFPCASGGSTYKVTLGNLLAVHASAAVSPHGTGTITPAMLLDRTRNILVPASSSKTQADADNGYGSQGWHLPAAENSTAYGNWKVPVDFVSTLTISGVVLRVTGGASANIHFGIAATCAAVGEAYSTHNYITVPADVLPSAQWVIQVVLPLSIAAAAVGDYVQMNFTYENAAGGEPAFSFDFLGFAVSYVADS